MGSTDRVKEAYCTTSQFAKLGPGYDRNCGPTAITNLILTLRGNKEGAEDVFLYVARLGARTWIYWRRGIMGHFGGTSDWFVRFLISHSLKTYGIEGYRVRGPYWINEQNMIRELERGGILYLMVHANRRYKSHHMLCYGIREQEDEIKFKLADGWTTLPRYLKIEDIRYGLFFAVRRKD